MHLKRIMHTFTTFGLFQNQLDVFLVYDTSRLTRFVVSVDYVGGGICE